MEARKVKDTNMIGNNVRETIFTDDSVVYEELREAVIASGVKRTLDASSTGTVSYAMDVTMDVNGKDKTFSALIYQNLKDSDKLDEGTFDIGARVNVALSRAKDKNGVKRTYGRIELPNLVTADDVIDLDSMSPEFRQRLEQLENASNVEAKKTNH